MASASSSGSVVGVMISSAKPAKATSPMRVEAFWRSTNLSAAASAACSRLGGMSVEHMLRETSSDRMMVARLVGTAAIGDGPAERQHEAPQRQQEEGKGQVPAQARSNGAAPRAPGRGSNSAP